MKVCRELSEFQIICKILDECVGINKDESWYLKNVDRENDWEGYISGKWMKKEYKKVC